MIQIPIAAAMRLSSGGRSIGPSPYHTSPGA